MNFVQLQCFLTVAKLRSFTEASEVLFMTQSAISKQIKRLEHELNTSLFHRYSRFIDLTEAGKLFYARAEALMSQYLNTLSDMEEFTSHARSGLAICIEPGAWPYGILDIIDSYMTSNPDVDLSIRERPSESIVERLDNGSSDIIFTWLDNLPEDKYTTIPLLHDPAVLITSPDHRLLHSGTVDLSELSNERIAILARDINKPYYRLIEKSGLTKNVAYDVARTESLFYLASSGKAVSMVLSERALKWSNSPIGIARIAGDPIKYTYSIAYSKHRAGKAVNAFINYVLAHLSEKEFSICNILASNDQLIHG